MEYPNLIVAIFVITGLIWILIGLSILTLKIGFLLVGFAYLSYAFIYLLLNVKKKKIGDDNDEVPSNNEL